MEQTVNLKKYLLIFLGLTILISIIIAFLKFKFDLKLSGVSIVVPFLAAMSASQKFIGDHKRAPTDEEAKRLTNLSFFYFIGFQVILFILACMDPEIQLMLQEVKKLMPVLIAVLVIVAIITYFMIRYAYGKQARNFADRIEKAARLRK